METFDQAMGALMHGREMTAEQEHDELLWRLRSASARAERRIAHETAWGELANCRCCGATTMGPASKMPIMGAHSKGCEIEPLLETNLAWPEWMARINSAMGKLYGAMDKLYESAGKLGPRS